MVVDVLICAVIFIVGVIIGWVIADIEIAKKKSNSPYEKMKKDFDKFEAKVERKLKKSDAFWDGLD